jgi:hypothetical protein
MCGELSVDIGISSSLQFTHRLRSPRFSVPRPRHGLWLSHNPFELSQPTGFAMEIMRTEFIWAITAATFLAVVLTVMYGLHVISVLGLTWELKRSSGSTGKEGRGDSERRRSKRLEVLLPVFVYGYRNDAKPFFEDTISLQVSAHGGLLVLATNVRVGQELLLTTDGSRTLLQPCRVARVGFSTPMRTEVAVEFAQPAPEFWQAAEPAQSALMSLQ